MTHTRVKALDQETGRVGGYLVVWGDATTRDLQGEYFTPQTELALDWYEQRPLLYQHGLDGTVKAAVIGRIDQLTMDEIGLWAEAQLDMHKRYAQAVLRLIEKGVLHWSSGSLAHLVDVTDGGEIKCWPLVEGSLTPTPAEPRHTDVMTLTQAYRALGISPTRWLATIERESESDHATDATHETDNSQERGHSTMTLADHEPTPHKTLPLASAQDARPQITVSSAFDGLDAMDMLHGYMLLRANKHFRGVSERYANALAHKVGQTSGRKTDELSYSTQTGYGDEWVPDLWSAEIWRKARQDNVVLPLFRSIEIPSNPFELPIEGTDPTVHYVPETGNEAHLTLGNGNPIPDSKIGSGKVQLSAKKLALRVGFSSELIEDSILPVLNIYREQAVRAIADSIDDVLLNGDTVTAGTGNINSDDAAPGGTEAYLAFDGLRRLALVTNSAMSEDMGNVAPTLAKMRTTRFLMPARYAARPSDLAWVVDGGTYAKLLGLDEFLTMDKAGAMATAQTGQIGFVDGIPVFVSAELPLTNAAGKIDTSGGEDRGMALCVYRPGSFVGYRRRIAVNVDYIPYYDSYQLTATVRVGFANFDNTVASALYNIAL